jgi:hypothetical protein
MNKKAAIKRALHETLKKRPNKPVTLGRPLTNIASLDYGNWATEFTFSEYNDDGDPSTEEEYNDIYTALQAIVNEHNSNVTE